MGNVAPTEEMKEESRPVEKDPARNLRFLLCDTTGNVRKLSSHDEKWVSSAIQCLNKAVDQKPGIIVVRFGKVLIQMREALDHEGVDFVKYVVADTTLDSNKMRKIIHELGPDDRLERHLEVVCPFLHYNETDSKHEMAVCGAYLDRMVLGGRRLHELCETEDHLHCEYYLNPRRKS